MQTQVKYTLFLSLLLISFSLFAQKKHSVGIHFNFGWNEIYQPQLEGAASHTGNGSSQWGLDYSYDINQNIRLISGVSLMRSRFTTTPAPVNPPETSHEDELGIITIPLGISQDWSKYIYFAGSLLFDIQFSKTKNSSIDDQSGIGLALGIGAKYQYKRLIFFIQPQFQMHSIFSFQESWKHERLVESSIKTGIAFEL